MHLRQSLLVAIAAAAALAASSLAAPPHAAAASPGLSYISDTSYTLDPAKGRVHIESAITVLAQQEPTATSRSYWEGIVITVPPSTAGFVANAAGKPLPLRVQASTSSNVSLAIGFGRRIYVGQPFTFDLQFDMVDHGGATDRDLRLTTTLSSFPVFAIASPDTTGSSVTVVFPPGYQVTQQDGGLQSGSDGTGHTIFQGTANNPGGLYAWFVAQTTPKFVARQIVEGHVNITVLGWADDPAWTQAVIRTISQGYAFLRNAIGLGDLPAQSLVIEETSLQDADGYSGGLDIGRSTMFISYYADPFVILHEMAHMWLNGSISTERWILEGFASYYSELAVASIGQTPRAPQLTERKVVAQIPLNDWIDQAPPGSIQEQYAYAASLSVATLIAGEAGGSDMRTIWQRIKSGPAPYQPIGRDTIEPGNGPVDWRSFLDYLEVTTGKSYEEIWRDWIIDPDQVTLLTERNVAQQAYQSAVSSAGTWVLPSEVRSALRAWDFGAAETDLAQVTQILNARAVLPQRALEEGTTFDPSRLRAAFETSLAAGVVEADGELAAIDALNAARLAQTRGEGAERDVGLLGGRDPVKDLAAARKAFAAGDWRQAIALADQARQVWDGATNTGRNRLYYLLGILAALLLAGGLAFVVPRRRARARRAALLAAAAATVSVIRTRRPLSPAIVAGSTELQPVFARPGNGNGRHLPDGAPDMRTSVADGDVRPALVVAETGARPALAVAGNGRNRSPMPDSSAEVVEEAGRTE